MGRFEQPFSVRVVLRATDAGRLDAAVADLISAIGGLGGTAEEVRITEG